MSATKAQKKKSSGVPKAITTLILAVVVANRHHEELSHMVDHERIYFADSAHALGILEAIDHYDFFQRCNIPENYE